MFYQIKDLERLSGIKAHTIRIWEKRYSVIEPHRTPTNIRYYAHYRRSISSTTNYIRSMVKLEAAAKADLWADQLDDALASGSVAVLFQVLKKFTVKRYHGIKHIEK